MPEIIGALLLDIETGAASRVAVEVVHADDEQTYLELSTGERALLLILDNADVIALATHLRASADPTA